MSSELRVVEVIFMEWAAKLELRHGACNFKISKLQPSRSSGASGWIRGSVNVRIRSNTWLGRLRVTQSNQRALIPPKAMRTLASYSCCFYDLIITQEESKKPQKAVLSPLEKLLGVER